MGASTSAGLSIAVENSTPDEIKAAMDSLSAEAKAKLQAVQSAGSGPGPKALFVLGGPGVGKGTQCAKIIEKYASWGHISAGDCLRAERKDPESKDGELINNYIKEGQIVPVAITVKLLKKAMDKERANGKSCFLIDGFPRNMDNVTGWNEVVGDQVNVAGVLFYDAKEEELTKRLLSRGEGRDDDNIDVITKRFKTYQNETMPIVDLFKGKGQAFQIDGMQSVDDVWGKTQDVINKVEGKA